MFAQRLRRNGVESATQAVLWLGSGEDGGLAAWVTMMRGGWWVGWAGNQSSLQIT